MSFPNGCHVCEVEIDPETGVVAVVGYAAVDDVGNIVHETIVEGQIHGGVAQGLGPGARRADRVRRGRPAAHRVVHGLSRCRARTTCRRLRVGHHVVPCTTNPLGVKGAGESGVAGSLPAGMNAILDALAERGVTHLDLPATPLRVWCALQRGS